MKESDRRDLHTIKSKMKISAQMKTSIVLLSLCQLLAYCQLQQQQQQSPFPGVSRDLGSFCAARPSLPIDLASMIVHVKKNVSFNYKLYLFSSNYVFQTGQVIPRDDFRVHSFPVKVKKFQDFWPDYLNKQNRFDSDEFFKLVPVHGKPNVGAQKLVVPEDALGDMLPGDDLAPSSSASFSHDVAHVVLANEDKKGDNLNKHVEFDRDDQLTSANSRLGGYDLGPPEVVDSKSSERTGSESFEQLVLPVGSFSSFHVNLTYLVRKDFDQIESEIIRILVDPVKFQVIKMEILKGQKLNNVQSNKNETSSDDYSFLSHKLLRDSNTRITSINQIYEDWITRDFYTIVYIQRRLLVSESHGSDEFDEIAGKMRQRTRNGRKGKDRPVTKTIINDRLVFRGSSSVLIGADQLDYNVKASAFITEKNGLHYYIEFLNTGKFYLCAIDWSKRPFKIIDSQQFPIKATRTQYDNEELLLCPPAVCYSDHPVDEIVTYGRLELPEHIQQQISASLSGKQTIANDNNRLNLHSHHENTLNQSITLASNLIKKRNIINEEEKRPPMNSRTKLNNQMIELIAASSSNQLQNKLHLRDWTWQLIRQQRTGKGPFKWQYELAKRNDIKTKPDSYGYTLAGHEIEASYRIYNELYLISSNHLVTINYTIANETVVGSIPIGEEFPGLVSTLIDPITAAFYDRYSDRIYFFKGDRYIGFDYATKKPLEDFMLKPGFLHSAILFGLESTVMNDSSLHILTSLPVVGILGRQHQVDAIYHDLATDLVYIFTGMKFYTFRGHEFEDGIFKSGTGELPQMYCINKLFLDGCNFDKAFANPCNDDTTSQKPFFQQRHKSPDEANAKLRSADGVDETFGDNKDTNSSFRGNRDNDMMDDFSLEQQKKLRSIASSASLFNLLVESNLISKGLRSIAGEPSSFIAGGGSLLATNNNKQQLQQQQQQEKLVIYLLITMIVTIIFVIIFILVLWINYDRVKNGELPQVKKARLATLQLDARHYLNNNNINNRHQLYQNSQKNLRISQPDDNLNVNRHQQSNTSRLKKGARPLSSIGNIVPSNKRPQTDGTNTISSAL